MNLTFALVLSGSPEGCQVQYMDGATGLADYAAPVRDRIRIRRQDLVAVDRDGQTPQIVWRWRRKPVLDAGLGRVSVPGYRGERLELAQELPWLADLLPGDDVWVAGTSAGWLAFDQVGPDGWPAHPRAMLAFVAEVIEEEYAVTGE